MQNIQAILKNHITNQNAVFVFPTDVACKKWADWVIQNSSVKAIAMERFMAWDIFKGECIRAKSQDLKTIPSLMRKIFADNLIRENARKPFLKNLISEKYAGEAGGFTQWISRLFPSLQMWKNLHDAQNSASNIEFSDSEEDQLLKEFYERYKAQNFTDDEDQDFQNLYEKYRVFLDENSLFDPAWIEPDFSGDGREYFLIYPEILEDWEQYRHKLEKIDSIHIVKVPEEPGDYEAHFFENASVEVKDIALFLREMHDEKKIEWSDMAVNVPNLENYGSYLDREFSLYEIPSSIRYSRPLSSYGAGIFFSQLQECVAKDFSYDSLKNLLLNEDLPWANKVTIDNLLLFGRMNNCICTEGKVVYEKGRILTVWDRAFQNPKDDRGSHINDDQLIKNLYKNLVTLIPPMVNAKTFAQIRSAYEEFREVFFDMAAFEEMPLSNNVLSRCIISLNEIVDLEEDFSDYGVTSPFSFFVSHLSTVQYLSQGENRAVQVYPYKSSPAAPYKIHVLVDSTQDSLSVADSFKSLDFVNENKRKIFIKMGQMNQDLGFSDSDPSFDFVKLYQHSALEKAYFTASRHAYKGQYGFAFGKLEKMGKEEKLSRNDIFAREKELLLSDSPYSSLKKIYSKQEAGLAAWKKNHAGDQRESGFFLKDEKLRQLIEKRLHLLKENKEGHRGKNPLLLGRLEVTQTTLKNYYNCPRKWLFKDVLKLAPQDKEAELIDEFIMGRVNHKVFENFFTLIKEKGSLIGANDEEGTLGDEYRKLLVKAINEAVDYESQSSAFKEIFENGGEKSTSSQMTIKIISSQYKVDEDNARENPNFRLLEKSLAQFCKIFQGYKVYALEKEVSALPTDENGNPMEGYYFDGKIDCILASSNESEYAIVDFKTSSTPSNLTVKEREEGKKEKVIDFQMPLYIYLLENNVIEEERLQVSAAVFYSIKENADRPFLGQAPGGKANKISEEEVELAKKEMLARAKRFYQEVSAQEFAVDPINQSRAVCAAKGQYSNCTDYQAVCRRYFNVAGEK
ncbi:MAG: PD-(D/E)XK nuclease family protein [Treponema sp.]|nr:PD-(D/E)XK nuclease family protein [Treponema sp.]